VLQRPHDLPVDPETTPANGAETRAPSIEVRYAADSVPGYQALVSLGGEHDLASSSELRATLEPILGNVLVDLTRCEFMDSTVIGVLLAKQKDMQREGRRLDLVVPRENAAVARVIDVVGMRELLTVHERLPLADSS
jgi:anti-sigma B factor antagonist